MVRSPVREISALAESVNTLQGAISAFSAFVPRGLVRQLIGSGHALELGGRSRFLTIMFTDLESFSTWAEATPAQSLLERVSAYFEAVTLADVNRLARGLLAPDSLAFVVAGAPVGVDANN